MSSFKTIKPKIIIDDFPEKKKNPRPASVLSKGFSPEKKRSRRVIANRSFKELRLQELIRPESADKGNGLVDPCATKDASDEPLVTAEAVEGQLFMSDDHYSLCRDHPDVEFTPHVMTDEEVKFMQFSLLKRMMMSHEGVREEDVDRMLDEIYPEYTGLEPGVYNIIQPQSLLSALGLSLDQDMITEAVSKISSPKVEISLDEKTRETIENLRNSLDLSSVRLSNTTVTHAIEEKTQTAILGGMNEITTILLVAAVVLIFRPQNMREKILVGFIVVGILSTRVDLMKMFQDSSLSNWLMAPVNEVQAQAFSIDDTSVMIVGLLNSFICLNSGPIFTDPGKLAKLVMVTSKTAITVASVMKMIHLLSTYVFAAIDKYYHGNPWFVKTGHSFIDEFLIEANAIIHAVEDREFRDLQSSLDRVRTAIVLGDSVQIKIPGNQEMIGLRLHVNNTLVELKRIKKNLLSSSFKFGGIRQEPASLLLRGAPGVGKSQAMQHFAHAIMALELSQEDFDLYIENPGSYICNRQAENVFWDGYKATMPIVFFDDILQARDVQGSPDNEAMNAIRAINVFENQLHCADIGAKGNTNFRSNFVIANTNAQNFKLDSINELAAFLRRWDIVVDVVPKDEFCLDPSLPLWSRRFDLSKLPKYTREDIPEGSSFDHLLGHTKIHPDMCYYHLQKLEPRENRRFVSAAKRMEFKEVVMLYYEKFLWKKRNHEVYLADLKGTLDEWRERSRFNASLDSSLDIDTSAFENDSDSDDEPDVEAHSFFNKKEDPPEDEFGYTLSSAYAEKMEILKRDFPDKAIIFDIVIKRAIVRGIQVGVTFVPDELYFTLEWMPDIDSHFPENPDGKDWASTVRFLTNHLFQSCTQTKVPRDEDRSKALSSIDSARQWIEDWKKRNLGGTPDKETTLADRLFSIYKFCYGHFLLFDQYVDKTVAAFDPFPRNASVNPVIRQFFGIVNIAFAFKIVKIALTTMLRGFTSGKHIAAKVEKKAKKSESPEVKAALEAREEAKKKMAEADKAYAKATSSIEEKVRKMSIAPESDERHSRVKTARRVNTRKPNVTAHSISNRSGSVKEKMDALVKRNVFSFYTPAPKSERRELSPGKLAEHRLSGYALGVLNRLVIVPYHFISILQAQLENGEIDGNDTVHMKRPGITYLHMALSVDEVLDGFKHFDEAEASDLAMFELPNRFNPLKDARRFIATEEQIKSYDKFDAVLHLPQGKTEMHVVVATRQENITINEAAFEEYTVSDVYKYRALVSPGDCGGILHVIDNHSTPTVVGLHVAGAPTLSYGYSTVLTRERVQRYIDVFGKQDVLVPEFEDLKLVDTEEVQANMQVVGAMTFPIPRSSGKSKYVKSHIHGMVSKPTRAPARLKPFTKWVDQERIIIDPMKKSLATYCEQDQYVNADSLSECAMELLAHMQNKEVQSVPAEVLTYKEAVLGCYGGLLSSIPRSTSSGYPWNTMPGPSNKTRFWGEAQDYNLEGFDAKELEERVNKTLRGLKIGVRGEFLYTDSLKDERRSFAKVEEGDTRLISCCPVDLLILFRMYFGSFFAWITANRIHNGCAVGVSEKSREWDIVGRNLAKFGTKECVGGGDHKGFDKRHKLVMCEAVLWIIQTWYHTPFSGVDARIRSILWLEITNSQHINNGIIYSWNTALPSGAPPTTTFNCLANLLAFRYCWKFLCSPAPFDKHCYVLVLGDDNIFCVDKGYRIRFNEMALTPLMATLGYVYTPENKEKVEHCRYLRNLEDVAFLKRNFIYSSAWGMYVAPLDLNSILDMIQWQKDTSNSVGDCEVLLSTALEELCLHGPDLYGYYHALIKSAVSRVPGLNMPENHFFLQNFKVLKDRFDEGTRPLLDYDEVVTNVVKDDPERLEEERGGLFSSTSRKPQLQPNSIPGTHNNSTRPVQRMVLNRTAAMTHSDNTSLTDNATLGLTDQGVMESTRTLPTRSDVTSDTTKATVDADTPHTQMTAYRPLHPELLNSARTGTSQDVRAFLAKPVRIAAGDFTSTDAYATFKYVSDGIPQSLLYSQPVWANKLSGNLGFKGDLHLSLQVNASRFQQGRYLLIWVPSGGGNAPDRFRKTHTASLTLATQCPHVEIDINCDTEATMIIPHVTAQGWAAFNQTTSSLYGNNGSIVIAAYQPLAVGAGSLTASWTLFAHFDNVEVAMPVQPQSSRVKTRVKRRVRVESVEQDSQELGPISAGFQTLAKASSALSGIPFISSVAGPASWALDLAAQVANVFGWSRPHNAEHAMIVQRYINPRFTNTDVADNSTKLAAMDSNTIEQLPGFAGSDLDEMSLSYLTSISCFYKRITWTMVQAPGVNLLGEVISPRSFYASDATGGVTTYSLAPVAFFSSMFALYRGSIKFTFKIVKTEFHTGRLLVAFKPTDATVGGTPTSTMDGTVYEHREILDIRNGSEFTLEIPYTSLSPYRSTAGADSSYGNMYLYILNALEAPSNVAQEVTILVEVSAGKDFELAQPSDFGGTPVQLITPQSGRNVCEITSEILGNAAKHESDASSRLCIGERIMSVRQLLKRYTFIQPSTINVTTANAWHEFQVWKTDMAFLDSGGLSQAAFNADMYVLLQSCYALQRGGLRIKYIGNDANAVRTLSQLVPFSQETLLALPSQTWSATSTPYIGSTPVMNRPVAHFSMEMTGAIELEIPFYNRFGTAAISDMVQSAAGGASAYKFDPKGPVPRNKVVTFFPAWTSTNSKPLIARSVGEDFSFGLFVSVPLLTGYSANFI